MGFVTNRLGSSHTVVFTGGGSLGHTMPSMPVMEQLRNRGCRVCYFGSRTGIERELVRRADFEYFAVSSERLRRYWSWRHFLVPIRVLSGIVEAWHLLRSVRPNVVFSKGGFVAVPTVIAAWLSRIPVVGHESDLTPGLANRILWPFYETLCLGVPLEWLKKKPRAPVVFTGVPLRSSLLDAQPRRVAAALRIEESDKLLLVFCGSQGSQAINSALRAALDELTLEWHVVHIVGRGNLDESLRHKPRYTQYEFVNEFGDLLTRANLVICRAGMTSLMELLALRKRAVLIPLPREVSRGDQDENATLMGAFDRFSILNQSEMSTPRLLEGIRRANHLPVSDLGLDSTAFRPERIIQELERVARPPHRTNLL
jgi:UDP-N-acetylglucosamine--N-acetylmuramyl-(pentapeptide) pyrophosphoryl-undecaprenol N-acetylglucosamine transferase